MKKAIPTKQEIEEQLLLNNNSANKVKKHFDVCYQTLFKWFEYHDIPYVKKAPGGKGNISSGKNTYEYWEELSKKFSTKQQIAEHLNVSSWVPHHWLTFHKIDLDGRKIAHNKKEIPSKEELEKLYQTKSILEISKHYGNVSNVTVKKWFLYHDIPLRTHSKNQKVISYPKLKKTNMERYGSEYLLPSKHSKVELEIKEWLNSLGFNFESNRKILSNNFELDGYDEKYKIAFEYCGLYFHSTKFKPDKRYHWNKFEQCRKNGIQLFTIFEHEWNKRKNQCKNFMKGALNISKNRIYARDCDIEIVQGNDRRIIDFLNEHHIQGAPNHSHTSSILFHEKEIVGVMTFSHHHRQNVNDCNVLSRLCWKNDYSVIGGAKRLFHYLPKNKPIISWSDNRWSSFGKVYERLGFVLEKEYDPDYSYTNSNGVFKSKQSMMKSKIGAADGQTENERALELGYYRIWDCGKKKWTFNSNIT